MKKIFAAFITLLASAAVFAQSAEGDFETKANTDGTVTVTKYVGWDTEVVIPAQIGGKAVTVIGAGAFENSGPTAVTIPEGVKSIEDVEQPSWERYEEGGAFARNKLTSVVIPGSLTFIGRGAFADNPLTSLTLGDGVETIGKSAFRGNKLTSVVIPDSVTSIGGYAFVNAKPALKSVTLGKGLIFIEDMAFYAGSNDNSISALTSVTLAANITADFRTMLGYGRESRSGIHYVFSTIEGRNLFDDYIAGGRKAGVYTLDKKERPVKTSDNLNYVETKYGAVITGGKDVTTRLAVPEKIGNLPVKAVWGFGNPYRSNNLARLRIPDTVTYIGEGAFQNNQLMEVVIPDSVTFIGNNAFRDNKLTSVTLGNSITHIGNEAFQSNQLTSIVIPDSVTFIGDEAFRSEQTTVSSVTLGANVMFGRDDNRFGFNSDIDPFGNDFMSLYNSNGKRAGVYTRSRTNMGFTAQ